MAAELSSDNAFLAGGLVLVDPDQNHAVHIAIHTQFLGSVAEKVQNREIDPRDALKIFKSGLPHNGTHLQYLEQDPTRQDQFDSFNEQQGELLKVADQIARLAQDQQEQEDQQKQQAPPPDPKMLLAQNKIMLDRAVAKNKIQLNTIKAKNQLHIADSKAAQKLAIERIKAGQKYSALQP